MSIDAIILGIFSVIAILLAPLIAIQINELISKRNEGKKRRLDLFRALMATRATTLSPLHVESLNRIDVEFYGDDKKSKQVVEAWKIYYDHLCIPTTRKEPLTAEEDKAWTNKGKDLLTELIYQMSQCVGYEFDKSHIKRVCYYPQGHSDIEMEQMIIRKGIADILQLKKPIPPFFSFVAPTEKESIDKLFKENKD
ncbi:MAG TPA: DUF6680 family protein [Desulfomonilia bacterium]